MQGNHIRTPKKLIKFHIIGDFSANIIWMAVICKDVHAKSLGDASCSLTNAPKTNNADCLLRKLDKRRVPKAPIRIRFPTSLMDCIVVRTNMVANFKQHGNSKLTNSHCTIGRNVGYRNTCFRSCMSINNIVSGCQNADEFNGRTRSNHIGTDGRFVGNNNIGITNPFADNGIICRGSVINRKGAKGFNRIPRQITRIFCISIQNYNFHGILLLF